MRCPSCGSRASADARFCDRCGAALGDDATRSEAPGGSSDPSGELLPPGGDRRVVTALFADLVDYVRLLAEHDPEEVRSQVTTALVAMAESIERLGGTREKFIGDAVFAVFGWPEAHDDDAVRAALAALSIRASLLEPGDGTEPLEVRIGIATGEVVTADRGPGGNGDLGLTGEAITTAARIQSLARPGEILVDGRTRDAARGRLALDGRGAVVLRGQSTPVELHALLGEAGLSAWTSHRAAAPGPLVGRDRERSILADALQRCLRTGHGETVLIVGDAGEGKSRLLAAIEPTARRLGFAWAWTENVSYARGEPYRWARLFAQTAADEHHVDSGTFLRQQLFNDDLDPATARRYGGAIAAIAREAAFSGWEAEAAHMLDDPAEVASTVAELAYLYLDRLLATTGPRVVIIDDLHWLDPSSIGIVELLVDATERYPLVVLAGSRPGPLPDWADRPTVTRLELHGLSEPETARLATLIARAALDADGARSIHERTAGNPLFITETVRAFLEDGTLTWRDGRVAMASDASPTVPVTLRAVLGARIDALDAASRETLRVASVVGIEFGEAPLVDLLGTLPAPGALERLAGAGLISPTGGGAWRFAHPLIRDAAYSGMLASRRRLLHARMADHLESQTAVAVRLGQIATHRAAAGDAVRALPLLREAAVYAMGMGAAAEAAAFWQRAAELSVPSDPVAAAEDRARADEAMAAASALREAAAAEPSQA